MEDTKTRNLIPVSGFEAQTELVRMNNTKFVLRQFPAVHLIHLQNKKCISK